jgi:hypothetical protein
LTIRVNSATWAVRLKSVLSVLAIRLERAKYIGEVSQSASGWEPLGATAGVALLRAGMMGDEAEGGVMEAISPAPDPLLDETNPSAPRF